MRFSGSVGQSGENEPILSSTLHPCPHIRHDRPASPYSIVEAVQRSERAFDQTTHDSTIWAANKVKAGLDASRTETLALIDGGRTPLVCARVFTIILLPNLVSCLQEAIFSHQLNKFSKEIICIMRTRTGFGVILY